jgi:hypothetical protein
MKLLVLLIYINHSAFFDRGVGVKWERPVLEEYRTSTGFSFLLDNINSSEREFFIPLSEAFR